MNRLIQDKSLKQIIDDAKKGKTEENIANREGKR